MNHQPILNTIVANELCTGCGACCYRSPKQLKMKFDSDGFWKPFEISEEEVQGSPEMVCPFNPNPEREVRTEDELSQIFLTDAPHYLPQMGRYYSTYVGYSSQFRPTSSSGGLATYILSQLFDQGEIDGAILVTTSNKEYFQYRLIKKGEELLQGSKTKYFPVTMASALEELHNFQGRIAVVGIGCFVKAIRLLQYYHPEIREKIIFTIGIICGGLKSSYYTDYLAGHTIGDSEKYEQPEYRIKNYNSSAIDYSFGCQDIKGQHCQLRMQTLGDMWGTGLFKNNACDFCEDVTSELADISLGDAWLYPYSSDGKGTNVIVTRSALAEELIVSGIEKQELQVQSLPIELFLVSQQGSFNHRHKGLGYRVRYVTRRGQQVPPKRHLSHKCPLPFKLVQRQRMRVRRESIVQWKNLKESKAFDQAMQQELKRLSRLTSIYHRHRSIQNKLKQLFQI